MADHSEDEAYLVLIDRHIEELEERLNALKELIASMVMEGQATRNQSELLINMLTAMKVTQALRAEVFEALNAGDNNSETRPHTN
jgi:hypothetical protein